MVPDRLGSSAFQASNVEPARDIAPNRGLLRAASALSTSRTQAVLTVRNGPVERSLWIRNGNVVAAKSNVPSERVEAILVAEGILDPALLPPMIAEARRQNRPISEQLVVDQLMSPTDVAAALERQVRHVVKGAILMEGHVRVETDVPPLLEVSRKNLANLIMDLFRSELPMAQVEAVLSDLAPDQTWMWIDPTLIEGVGLQPWETRLVRRAKEPFDTQELFRESNSPERTKRFLASMIALQAITFESEQSRALATAGSKAARQQVIALGS